MYVHVCEGVRERHGERCVVTDPVKMVKISLLIQSNKASSLVVGHDFLFYVIYTYVVIIEHYLFL
jgi:hypothetical protein